MTIDQLKELFPQLKEYGVTHFRLGNLEIKMPEQRTFGAPRQDNLPEMQDVPPDLRADDLMSFDKVLHWSSDNTEESTLPLTGEKTLDEVI